MNLRTRLGRTIFRIDLASFAAMAPTIFDQAFSQPHSLRRSKYANILLRFYAALRLRRTELVSRIARKNNLRIELSTLNHHLLYDSCLFAPIQDVRVSSTIYHAPSARRSLFCIALLHVGLKKLKCASCLSDFRVSLEFPAILSTCHLHYVKSSYYIACPSYIYLVILQPTVICVRRNILPLCYITCDCLPCWLIRGV